MWGVPSRSISSHSESLATASADSSQHWLPLPRKNDPAQEEASTIPPPTNSRQRGHSSPSTNEEYTGSSQEPRRVARKSFIMVHPQTVRGSHYAAEEPPAVVNIEDLGMDDVVIAVMGPTGSGKSTFISSASGCRVQGVGHGLRSFTNQVHAIRFLDQESRRQVVLVDTPGFDDTFKSDLDVLTMISDWLNSSYKKKKLLSGILYLHRITDNRMAGTPLKNLRVFRELCGRDALDKVYLTTTMWDEVDLSVGEGRLDELRTDYWKAMIAQGAQIARCRSGDDSPKQLVRRILAHESPRKVLLQEEMVELKKQLKETAAGKQLYSQLEMLVERQTELLRRISKERKVASKANVLVELQKEHDALRAQIDDKLHQMKELKSARWWDPLRLFSKK